MAASVHDLSEWFDRGVKNGQRYMIVVCDTFDYDDYPVFCTVEEFKKSYQDHNDQNMQRIMEVYDLSMPKEEQLKPGTRVMNFPRELIA